MSVVASRSDDELNRWTHYLCDYQRIGNLERHHRSACRPVSLASSFRERSPVSSDAPNEGARDEVSPSSVTVRDCSNPDCRQLTHNHNHMQYDMKLTTAQLARMLDIIQSAWTR